MDQTTPTTEPTATAPTATAPATVAPADTALLAAALGALDDFRPPGTEQAALREAYRGLLAARPDALWRSCAPGHLTASALVVDPTRRAVLLNLHGRVGLWLQFGGHLEEHDRTMAGAALREATEESGIEGLRLLPAPVDLDVHAITCSLGVPTRHFDVRYVAVAPAGAEPVCSDESIDVAWFGWDALPEGLLPDTRLLVARSLAALECQPDAGIAGTAE